MKKPPKFALRRLLVYEKTLLDLNDVLGLEALVALGDVELDAVTLVQRFVTVHLNRRVVHKYVLATVLGDETKTLFVLEPLHSTLSHC